MTVIVSRESVELYNQIMDYCETPRSINELVDRFGIDYPRMYQKMRYLALQSFVTKTKPKREGRHVEFLFKTASERRMKVRAIKDVDVPSNFKTAADFANTASARFVSSDDYHTKGSSGKRSVWIGSTADLLF